ncbi:non-ribosomal peptide synthetase [Brevibacillus brevis]|uniref:non-ribosomal peptide synthetase n=1 Tax=Brevibacillus brevis TaxID=1393 RepID=UPI001C8D0903|nr:non-ribosomal peptide synthetase [Brevibacillus brevis]MBY0088466.1 amino acid adenylation domain-containing protein [Brevibacillus brevis]
MMRREILMAYKEGKLSAAEVQEKLLELETPSFTSPLSVGQQGLWMLQKMSPTMSAYNVPLCFCIRQKWDVALLKQACHLVSKQHPILQSSIMEKHGVPYLLQRPEQSLAIEQEDISSLTSQEVLPYLRQKVKEPFSLEKGSLLRIHLLSRSEEEHYVLITVHHIIFDGHSSLLFLQDLVQAYIELVEGKQLKVTQNSTVYADFVKWEQDMMASEEGGEHRAYWLEQLSGTLPQMELPADRPRSSAPSFEGQVFTHVFSREWSQQVKQLSKHYRMNPSVLLLGIFKALLYRYTGQTDVIVGMPTMGRPEERFDSLIGYFVNMIPIRSQVTGDKSFSQFIRELQLTLIDGMDHAVYPFPAMVREANIPRLHGSSPVFDIIFTYQNFLQSQNLQRFYDKCQNKLAIELIEGVHQEGEYEFELEVFEQEAEFVLNLKYNPHVFDQATIQRMADHYQNIANEVIKNPDIALDEISLISAEERHMLLVEWNETDAAFPQALCIHDLFEKRVQQTPNAVAVVYENQSLTYRELDERVTKLAIYLQAEGAGPEATVGICVERSLEMVIGILGILKAGAAYVPLDPTYSTERLAYMLEDSKSILLLTQARLLEQLSSAAGENTKCIVLDRDWEEVEQTAQRQKTLNRVVNPTNLAYVIYTSGSTGKPKGVMVSHESIINTLFFLESRYPVMENDVYLLKTNYVFDVSLSELFGWFIGRGHLVILPPHGEKSPEMLAESIMKHRVTHVNFVPAMLNVFVNGVAANQPFLQHCPLKYVMVAGEAFPKELVKRTVATFQKAKIENIYGPTEASIYAAWFSCSENELVSSNTPIGRPVANTQLYIVDRHMNPVPVGVSGELCIAGKGLARGYLNRPELTAEKFVDNPFTPGTKLYKTGDLTRWLPDGTIEYLGRIDHQVKIRGFRIELGEIESQLMAHPQIQSVVVLVKEEGDHKRLVAYYVPKAGANHEQLEPSKLREYLRRNLPEYMLPAFFVSMDKIPLTANGKVDRTELLSQKLVVTQAKKQGLPQSDIEQRTLKIWQDVLNVEGISTEDGFFDVGGDSILATMVVAKMTEEFQCDLNVTTLFKYVNIREISEYIAAKKEKELDEQTDFVNPNQETAHSVAQVEETYPEYYEDSIAIIGISCHFPGAKNHREFWENLRNGVESVRFFSDEEIDQLHLPDEYLQNPNFIPVQSTIEGKDHFDPGFFHLSARDAEFMDPQFRLLLTHSWKALEDAGYTTKQVPQTGVFMSASNSYYQALLPHFTKESPNVMKDPNEYVSWVLAQGGTIPTMISHKMGLKGPSFAVHSNCSSSLVGLHLAYRSLQSGESKVALVGGATIFPTTYTGYVYQAGLNFSSDGHCKTFDASADGMIGGEGVGVVVLKKASDAIKDGDHIYALMRGIRINNDGADKVGFYAPSIKGQAEVIQQVLDDTKVHPETISYIEAHGTGTYLGDPIEFAALNEVYTQYTSNKQYCGLGSVKTNIGHLDTAAGLAGCIKVALSLYHNEIPPSLNYEKPNPNINLDQSPFYVVDTLKKWEDAPVPHRAALSSFGLGGTNAHAIFEQWKVETEAKRVSVSDDNNHRVYFVPLSAKNDDRVQAYAQQLVDFLRGNQERVHLADLAYTLQVGREAMESRAIFIVKNTAELIQKLSDFLHGEEQIAGSFRGNVKQASHEVSRLKKNGTNRELITKLFAEGKGEKAAELWSKGLDIEWEVLYNDAKPRRISLPTYPFAEESYGVPENVFKESGVASVQISPIPSTTPKTETLLLQPCWNEQEISQKAGSPAFAEHLVILCEWAEEFQQRIESEMNGVRCLVLQPQSQQESIAERFQTYTVHVFTEIQRILASKPKGKVLIQLVVPAKEDQQCFSALSGLLKTAHLENPKLIGQLIEVQAEDKPAELVHKLQQNSNDEKSKHIRYQDGKRWVSGWTEMKASGQAEHVWKDDGVYLITGGAGGLGLIFAKEITQQTKGATVIITGRSSLDEEKTALCNEWKTLGANIQYRRADITQKQAVEDLFQAIKQEFGSLTGIIHSAGVIRDSFIMRKTADELEQVLAPKVTGLMHLDEASKDMALDFFILFSSGVGCFGNAGQADYAAANAFMDQYAKYRHGLVKAGERQGQTLCINWPLWKEGGMRVDEATEKIMEGRGMIAMPTASGIQALYQGVASGTVQMLVIEGNLPTLKDQLLGTSVVSQLDSTPVHDAKLSVDAGVLKEKTLYQLKVMFGQETRLGAGKIAVDEPFETYGIDSIMVIQLNKKLGDVFSELSKTILYEYQTLDTLADYLVADHRQECMKWTGLDRQGAANRGTSTPLVRNERDTASHEPIRSTAVQSGKQIAREPIAIIGMSGRYPKARSLNEYWENLKSGKDCITEIPEERWSLDDFFEPDPDKAVAEGKSYGKWGGFVDGFAEFDPLFFNMSPWEAMHFDPQERLFMESCWEVLEDAGYTRQQLAEKYNRRVGVFGGITKTGFSLYGPDLWKQGELIYPHTSFSSLTNRVSYFLNLQGPSMPIDTMCSASLTAIHEACEHLYNGDCELAIAGGVNLYLHPSSYVFLSALHMLSVDGQCKSFGQGGNGFVPGEGVGTVLLKPLSKAIADGDHIYGLIRGTSVNHGGKTNGYTVPNPTAQGELIRQALDKAGVHAKTVSYIEAHGTGTELGDPIEITGLIQAFRKDTQDTGFCAIGSVKSNIGHLEAAAGIAGVAKILLQMKHQQLVPSLHAQELNPNIPFSKTPFVVQQDLAEWKRPLIEVNGEKREFPRIAGISSFGAGGSNAHVVIEEYIPAVKERPTITVSPQNPAIIVLSAKNKERLVEQVQRLLASIEEQAFTDVDLADIAYTLQVGREAMEERLALMASSLSEMVEKLQSFLAGDDSIADLYRGQVKRSRETTDIFAGDEELQEAIEKWMQRKKFSKLLDFWVKGLNMDWNKLYDEIKPRRISLPAYPFARENYWLPKPKTQPSTHIKGAPGLTASLHPLLHQNTSDLREQRFSSTFDGQEFFLSDHVVKGKRILPGVAYLEMARAAADLAAGALEDEQYVMELKNVVWAQPIVVEDTPVEVHIGIYPEDNGDLRYEIYSEPQDEQAESVVHSQGGVVFAGITAVPTHNLDAIKAQCSYRTLHASECYDAFQTMGLVYGPAQQGIEHVYVGEGQVLAKLAMPSKVAETQGEFVLHPSMLDSALQSSIGLLLGTGDTANLKPILPFALEKLSIFSQTSSRMWVWIRQASANSSGDKVQKVDIDLCDDQGTVCVRMQGFSARVLEGEVATMDSKGKLGALLVHPEWKELAVASKAEAPDYTQRVVMMVEPDHDSWNNLQASLNGVRCIPLRSTQKGVAERFIDYTTQVVEEIQGIFKQKVRGKVLVQIVVPLQAELPSFIAFSGLLKTANLENPSLIGQVIEIESGDDEFGIAEKIKENVRCPLDVQIRYQSGKRYVAEWVELDAPQETSIPWKHGGVYLITGGAGGLGYIFANEIVQKVQQANFILTGRSPLDQEKQGKLQELKESGASVEYRQVDVTQKQEMAELIRTIQQDYGRLHGIIHSAGVLRDSYILRKNREEVQTVLHPKVTGLINLDEASKDVELDFLVLFSSVAGSLGNIGQADYACANAFMDGFAHYRNGLVALQQRHGQTLSMNWPLWKEGGMQAGAEAGDMLEHSRGVVAMQTSTGIGAMYQGLASGKAQVMVMEGDLAKLKQTLVLQTPVNRSQSKHAPVRLEASETADTSNLLQKVEFALMQTVSDLLQVPTTDIDVRVELSELGFNQVLLTEFANKLNQQYHIGLIPNVFVECPTLQQLASYLLEEFEEMLVKQMQPVASITPTRVEKKEKQATATVEQNVLREKATHFVKKEFAEVLQLPVNRIEEDASMETYGIDSILSMKLTNQLEKSFGSLPKTLFFEYQTIHELIGYFLDSYRDKFIEILGLTEQQETVVTRETASVTKEENTSKRQRNSQRGSSRKGSRFISTQKETQPAKGALDVAIIGVSGRYPKARNTQEFWNNLRDGKDCITEIPKDRWNHSLYFDEDKNKRGKTYSKWGGFIDGVDQFDPLFFNISPLEAEIMDPQERLFLECVYETLEDAGYTRESLGSSKGFGLGGNVGVYVGIMYEEYQLYGAQETLMGRPMALGGSFSSVANRVSYFFNFHGPSVAVDTMCSSSLTGIHFACQSLLRGECEAAIAGGVNVSIHPNKYLMLGQGKFASSKGRCESFGLGGDGYVPGEGVGAVLLKPLAKAIADGDQIYGVIKGSAINHGGKTNGYTVPNPNAQASVIGRALKEAGIDPRTISYLEAHGTGTSLGDPIEIAGLTKAFQAYTTDKQFCSIGSAKSNIGHCESAAGIAGITKILLQLKHGQLAPSLHAEVLNPNIDFSATPFVVQQELAEWKRPVIDGQEFPRRSGVSSFGAGGSNAHIVLEEYIPDHEKRPAIHVSHANPAIILLSAKNESQLHEQALRLLAAIKDQSISDLDLADIAYTLQVGREAMEERLAVMAGSVQELQEKLTQFVDGQESITDVFRGQVKGNKKTIAVFEADEDLQKAIDAWISKRKYAKLLDLWVSGGVVDWHKLYGEKKPRRISLPTYPFARERYWIPQMDTQFAREVAATSEGTLFLHPLLQKNTSELLEQRYSSTFRGQEFFLADHVVNGQQLLPSVAYLEMARAAIDQSAGALKAGQNGLTLKNMVWAKPIAVDDQPVDVHIGLQLEDSGEIGYRIYSEHTGNEAKEIVHSQGSAVFHTVDETPTLDLAMLQDACSHSILSGSQCYEFYKAMGMQYGPALQGIVEVHKGTDRVLAKLSLPFAVLGTEEQFVLHPSMMDSALQAAIGLFIGADDKSLANNFDTLKPILPFALDELEIFSPCARQMWAYIRYSDDSNASDHVQKLDIDLCDEQGNVLVRMKRFSSRKLDGKAADFEATEGQGMLVVHPCWKEQAVVQETETPAYAQHIVMMVQGFEASLASISAQMNEVRLIPLQSQQEDIADRFEAYASQVFLEIQSLFQQKILGKVLVQVVVPDKAEQSYVSGLSGLLKTAQQENPNLIGQFIEINPGEHAAEIASKLQENACHPMDDRIRYQEGKRYVLGWCETKPLHDEVTIPWKDQGTYLITGGAGGLGLIFAREIANQAKRATLILTGRSPLREDKQAMLHEWEKSGARVVYRQVDVTDKQEVIQLIQSIQQEFGGLHGIIHSAGVVRDNFILKKTTEEWDQVVAPKVAGLTNLDEASKDQPLDFFVLFSSIAGSAGNSGQADYACANAFMDGYSKDRNERVQANQRQGQTVSINWPLWKEGGMQVDEAVEEMVKQRLGMIALHTATGIRAFYEAVASRKDQVMVMEGDLQRLHAAVVGRPKTTEQEVKASTVIQPASHHLPKEKAIYYFKKLVSSVIKLPIDRIEADALLEKYGIDSIMVMQLTNELEKTFGSLSKTLFFEYQTIEEIAKYFLAAHGDQMMSILGMDEKETPTASPVKKSSVAQTMVAARAKPIIHNRRSRGNVLKETTSETKPANDALDIAIIGVSGRYPKARNMSEFWRNLRDGKDCVTEIPEERWDHSLFFDADKKKQGKTYSKWGGFLDGVHQFDPLFFNITPREAEIMDPQERLFLECVYETLEDAGYTRESLGSTPGMGLGGNVGVYVGVMYEEYQLYGAQETMLGRPMALAGSPASIANRVSYFCNFHGPSMAVDTMCSSSLTTIHLACQSLQQGECEAAIAGGVNISIHPNKYLMLGQGKFASSKGRCESFGIGGDGYVPGEGVGAVLLKPLAKAIADGDQIYGVIKGTAVNHGGKTNGYNVPSPNAQARVIGRAFQKAGIDPRTISYLEAHGTGTSLGDPIEITGLTKAFQVYTNDKQFCAIGSAKSNIGHCESAAGIAGVTKVLLQLKHGQLAPSLHAEVLNPNIDFSVTPFVVQQELAEWKRPVIDGREAPRRAGVSSFGAGGSNAHVVIEEYIPKTEEQATIMASPQNPALILLSAKNEDQLQQRVQRLLEYIAEQGLSDADLAEMAYTLQVGREPMEERLAVIAGSMMELEEKLKQFIGRQKDIEDLYHGQVKRHKDTLAIFAADDDMPQMIDSWMNKGKYSKLLDVWVKGLNIDWSSLYGERKPRRISLPTYPFSREAYWVPGGHTSFTGAASRSTYEQIAVQPDMRILKKQWKACPAMPTKAAHRTIGIFTTDETKHLAIQLSNHFAKCEILELNELESRFHQDETEWKNYDGIIDLIGCGRQHPDSLAWIPWLQQLIENGHKEGLTLLGVTKGLESFQNDSVNLTGASRVGVYRMLQSEYKHLQSRHVDLEPLADGEELAQQIAAEFLIDAQETEVCYRAGERYRAYLQEERVADSQEPAFVFPENHVLLITGGTRGLGYLCAKHFVERHGVKKLVLTGRESLPPREQWGAYETQSTSAAKKIRAVQALEKQDVQVEVLSVSLTDEEAWQQHLRELKQTMGPIGGVIHCAGFSDDQNPAFIRKTTDGIQQVLQPKVAGLHALYELCKDEPLQFFVLFSSVSAIIPSLAAGQSDYALANAYMDFFAAAHADFCPIVSIQWPSWKETGIGAVTTKAYQQTGLVHITDEQGLRLLDHILLKKIGPVVFPAAINEELWEPQQLMQHKKQEAPVVNLSPHRPPAGKPTQSSVGLEKTAQTRLIELFAKELKIDPARLEIDKEFPDYGIDSVLLAQVMNEISKWLGKDLDPTILYEYPTIETLAEWLTSNHGDSISDELTLTSPEMSDHPKSQPIRRETKKSQMVSSQAPPYNQANPSDIAVVGLSCRFPGARNVDEYWKLLAEGRSAIGAVPKERWGYQNSYHAGLLDNITAFDPSYFLIAKEDAKAMDPQALLVLEESLHLWHQAGYTAKDIKGRAVGVYIGARSNHRPSEDRLHQTQNPIMTVGQNYLATNISQYFDLRGPSMVIDTACSSALVGMNMAIHSLRSGEIEAAIVGGVNVLNGDEAHRMFHQRGILSEEPAFHIFDKRAGGLVLGEGVGMVLLKTVEQALADGDEIHAVIKGVAVNNDGRTAGPATPNLQAQKEVMQSALAKAGVNPEQISYIEANGSGSEVTDLLELKAIQSVYRSSRMAACGLGSIKPNIGHPLCAEGIASLIKVVLMLKHQQLVPFLSGQEPMTHFHMESTPFYFQRQLSEWNDSPRIAAINCFADGGTNANVVLQSWEEAVSRPNKRHSIAPPTLNRFDVYREEAGRPTKTLTYVSQKPNHTTSIWKRQIVEG